MKISKIISLIAILICIIFLTSCKETDLVKTDNTAESKKNEDTKKETKKNNELDNVKISETNPLSESTQSIQINGKGTIDDPYEFNNHFNTTLNCQIPGKGDKSSITIEISRLSFSKNDETDVWVTEFGVKLIDHKGNFPIKISDYLNVVYYDNNNNIIGNEEPFFRDEDNDDAVELVFNKERTHGPVGIFEKSAEFNNQDLSKVSLKYYDNGEYKEIFFKKYNVPGTLLNPFSSTESSLIDYAAIPDNKNTHVNMRINAVSLSKTESECTLKVDLKCNSISFDGNPTSKAVNASGFLTVVYYDKEGAIGKSDYPLNNVDGSKSIILETNGVYNLYSTKTFKELNNKIPTVIGLKYYNTDYYRVNYYNVEN